MRDDLALLKFINLMDNNGVINCMEI